MFNHLMQSRPRRVFTYMTVIVTSFVWAGQSFGWTAMKSSFEPGSQTQGSEYIYDSTANASNPQPTTLYDGWYPYPAGDGGADNTFPFGQNSVFTYSVAGAPAGQVSTGVTTGSQALVVSKDAQGPFWVLQRSSTVNIQQFARATAVSMDITFDKALYPNPTTPTAAYSTITLAINSPEGFVNVPAAKELIDPNTFQDLGPSGNTETITPADPGHTNPNIGEWTYGYTPADPANNVETYHITWNLLNPAFQANGNGFSGMQYMAAVAADNNDGTALGYGQFNIGYNAAYTQTNPADTSNPNSPYDHKSSIIIDNFSVTVANILGDVNLDGKVTAADVQSLLTALTNVPAYEAANNNAVSPSDFLQIADVNGDGVVDNRDVQALISLVASQPQGGGAIAAVPEPASFMLFAAGATLMVGGWWRRNTNRFVAVGD